MIIKNHFKRDFSTDFKTSFNSVDMKKQELSNQVEKIDNDYRNGKIDLDTLKKQTNAITREQNKLNHEKRGLFKFFK